MKNTIRTSATAFALALAVTGCVQLDAPQAPVAASSDASTSATPSASETTSATPSPSTSPQQETASPETSSSAPSPAETTAEPTSAPSVARDSGYTEGPDWVANAGENCGTFNAEGAYEVFVSQGTFSCSEARRILRTYHQDRSAQGTGSTHEMTIEGMTCYTSNQMELDVMMLESSCAGGDSRGLTVRPAGTRILTGLRVTDFPRYMRTASGNTDPNGNGINPVYFQSPANDFGCVIDPAGYVNCLSHDGSGTAYLVKGTQRVTSGIAPATDSNNLKNGGYQLKVGSTISAYGISCNMENNTTVHCVNQANGFRFNGATAYSD